MKHSFRSVFLITEYENESVLISDGNTLCITQKQHSRNHFQFYLLPTQMSCRWDHVVRDPFPDFMCTACKITMDIKPPEQGGFPFTFKLKVIGQNFIISFKLQQIMP